MKKLLLAIIIIQLVMVPVLVAQRGPHKPKRGGCMSCLMGLFFGPRAGFQYNEGVGIRTIEWIEFGLWFVALGWIPRIIQLADVFGGKTWTEIEIKERLRDPDFVDWHKYMVEKYK